MTKEKYNLLIKDNKKQIRQFILLHKYEEALSKIANMANMLYESNQYYVDDDLENALLNIQKQLQKKYDFEEIKDVNTKTVLFYDGFGLDSRGLAYIYIKALVNLGYKVIYVTIPNAQGNIPRITKLIENAGGEIVFCRTDSYTLWYQYIYKVFSIVKPAKAFFYTTPYDVSAVMAFNQLAGQVERYQINLTDHAFWLGVNVFDFCLEFREYGAGISHYKRGIAAEKLLMQPFYPWVGKKEKFAGYPFEREQDDFIIFSGGNVYKIIDKNKTYYKMVAEILKRHGNVKFWYASNCELPQDMKLLIEQFPGRVFFTDERIDLLAVLENIDMYLSTYPIAGGLMYQYVAMAGKVPYTLCADEESKGMLLNEEDLGIYYYDLEEMLSDVDRYITDEAYRAYKNNKMKNTIIKPESFISNLNLIMTEQKSAYYYTVKDYDVRNFQKIY